MEHLMCAYFNFPKTLYIISLITKSCLVTESLSLDNKNRNGIQESWTSKGNFKGYPTLMMKWVVTKKANDNYIPLCGDILNYYLEP